MPYYDEDAMERGADDGRDQYEPDPQCENCEEYDCDCIECDSCYTPFYPEDLDAFNHCKQYCEACEACDCDCATAPAQS